MVVDIIVLIIIGAIIGLLGKLVAPGDKDNIPIWLTILCGIGGVILGWFVYRAFGGNGSAGVDWVRFRVRPWQESPDDEVVVECPVHDVRSVRSSSGHVQERYVVEMLIILVGREVTAEVTLTNRDQMGFRMLIGREALRQGFDVTSSRSFLGQRAPRVARKRNKGEV